MLRVERIHLLSRADMLKPLREFVHQLAKKQGCCEENIDSFVMAINEACMNVIQHAYKNKNNEEIIVEFYKQKNELIIKVIDFASCVDISQIKSRNLDDIRPGGLGVHIIKEAMDSVEYKHAINKKGNILEMRKQLKKCISNN